MRALKEAHEKVQWVYSSRDNEELAARYDQWAEEYDRDLDEGLGYTGPRMAVEVLARHVPRHARILDAGAGTGMVGAELRRLGYADLVAMDLSEGMLSQAREKGLYTALHRMAMGGPLGFADNSFDATICVGVLTLGHAPASSLDELVRITRPEGYIVFTLRPDVYENDGFRQKQEELASAGRWQVVEVTDQFQSMPKGEPDIYHQVWLYQVTDA